MFKNKGFTLIELLVVIIILGILSVTAAPKFLNFGAESRIANTSKLKAAFDTAVTLINAKARLENKTAPSITTINTDQC